MIAKYYFFPNCQLIQTLRVVANQLQLFTNAKAQYQYIFNNS